MAGGEGGDAPGSDEVNEDYAEKVTQMVLEYMDRQKDQPDPELLEDLNWTERDLQEFVERWKEARDLADSGDEDDKIEWKEKLRELGLRPPKLGARQGSNLNDSFQQMQDSGSRIRRPEALSKEYDAYLKSMQRRQQ